MLFPLANYPLSTVSRKSLFHCFWADTVLKPLYWKVRSYFYYFSRTPSLSMNRIHFLSELSLVVVATAATLLLLASFAIPAHAATDTSSTGSFTKDLTVGMTGVEVTALQNWLIGKGYGIPAGATGLFGGQTRAAVTAWQKAVLITPSTGYFGPKSRAALIAGGGATSTSPTTAKLSGGSGYLTNITSLGNVETVMSAGDDEKKVVGVSARATSGDLALARLDVQFDLSGSSGSTNLNSYVQSVSVYEDGKKLATMNPSDGSYQNKVWTLRFNNLTGLIKQGNTSNIYVEVTPVGRLRDSETDGSVAVSIPKNGIRTVDTQGVSDQYSSSAYSSTFSINQGVTGTLNFTEASDNPRATTLKADLNNATTNVTLVSFKGKTTYEDAFVKVVPLSLTVTGTPNVSDVVQSVSLMKGSTVLATKTISTTGTTVEVDFNNLNETILQDASAGYSVVATVRKIGTGASGSAFDNGDTLKASIFSGSGAWDVLDSTGYGTILSGSVVGGLFTLQSTGITVTQVSTSAITNIGTVGSGDNTQYAISFKLMAGDQDLYLSRTTNRSLTPSTTVVTWATTTSSTASSTDQGTASLTAADTNSADAASGGIAYKIPAGSTRTFTLNVTLVEKLVGSAGLSGVQLTGLGYGTTTAFGSTFTSGLDQFKTQDKSMTVH